MKAQRMLSLLVRSCGAQGLKADPKTMGEFFYRASRDPETQDLFGEILFTDRPGYPVAPSLASAVNRLKFTGIIGHYSNGQGVSPIQAGLVEPGKSELLPGSEEEKQFRVLLGRFKEELCVWG